MQNITHGSEVDNTEDSYLLSVVKEIFNIVTLAMCTCLHASVFVYFVERIEYLSTDFLQGYNRAHN